MEYLLNVLQIFELSSRIREQSYIILFLSVSIKSLNKINYLHLSLNISSNQVLNIINTFGASEKMKS